MRKFCNVMCVFVCVERDERVSKLSIFHKETYNIASSVDLTVRLGDLFTTRFRFCVGKVVDVDASILLIISISKSLSLSLSLSSLSPIDKTKRGQVVPLCGADHDKRVFLFCVAPFFPMYGSFLNKSLFKFVDDEEEETRRVAVGGFFFFLWHFFLD